MARERCAACSGSGSGINGRGPCVVCGGTGSIWVPDKVVRGPVGGPVRGPSGGGLGDSTSIEELLLRLLIIAAFGYSIYYGITQDWEWYWVLGLGGFAGFFTYFLFTGPLRFVLTLAKWIIVIGFLAMIIWGVIKIWQEFS